MTAIEVPGICERDLDLLLLEEFVASRPFFEWFMSQIGMPASAQLTRVARSVTTSSGESDLDLTVQDGARVVRILVENKIDATLQPQQAARYRERGQHYLRNGDCTASTTVIIAPSDYFPDDSETFGFDCRMSYEALVSWFERAPDLGPRAHYAWLGMAAIIAGFSEMAYWTSPLARSFGAMPEFERLLTNKLVLSFIAWALLVTLWVLVDGWGKARQGPTA